MSAAPADDTANGAQANGTQRHEAKRYSGKRVALVLGLLLSATLGAALLAFLATRTPDGPVLALVAVNDEEAVVLRDDPRRGHVYLSVETAAGTERSLALFGVPPGSAPRVADDLITVPVTGARGVHEVDAFTYDGFDFVYRAGQPDPEDHPPVASSLPLTLGEGRVEVALYGEPVMQAVGFRRADGHALFRVDVVPSGDAPVQVWPTSRGLLFFDGSGVTRAYDRSHDVGARPPRDPQPVGGPGASFCASGEGWLFLTRAGSLHRLAAAGGAPERVADGLPTDLSLLACGARGASTVLFLGDAVHGGVARIVRLDADGEVAAKVALATGEAEAPRLQVVGDLPRFVAVVDGEQRSRVVDIDEGAVIDTPSCAAGARLLLTPEGTYAVTMDSLTRTDGDSGHLRAFTIPGLSAERALDSTQLSPTRIFVPAGSGFVVLERADLSLHGVNGVEGAAPRDGC